ncbi:Phenylalanine 2-monooxygenase precursor precursor [compost metagenome]
MSVSVIWDWARSAGLSNSETIAELLRRSRHYRHPDSAQIAYPYTVETPLGFLPPGNHRIAIVGAGAAGIAALYELSRLAAQLEASDQVTVDLYDSDPDHFLAPRPVNDIAVRNRKAGRVSAARVSVDGTDRTVYEVGAMRFPEIAGLTWHYASQVFDPQALVKVFPNPGKVPTEFVFADRVDRYGNNQWQDPDSPTRRVFEVVLKYFPGKTLADDPNGSSLFKIGGFDPAEVAKRLASQNTSEADLLQISADWKDFVREHDHTTLAGAVRKVMVHASAQGELPLLPGLDEQGTIDHCVELFGRFGFGTGGFKPLFNISLVEMMRLVLWDYSNEYTLPVEENVDFIRALHERALQTGASKLVVNFNNGRVCDCHHFNPPHSGTPRRAKLWYYDHDLALQANEYDFVILAMPQDQLAPLIRRSGHSPAGKFHTRVGDAQLGLATSTAVQVFPALQLSRTTTAPTERIVSAIGQLHMTRSSKVFGVIRNADSSAPEVPQFNGAPIQAVVSDSGLAASYIVPSTLDGQPYSSFLASYTWDDDSTRLQQDYAQYPQNPGNEADQGSAHYMFQTMINRVDHDVFDPQSQTYRRWWFGTLLSKVQTKNRFVYDWTTHRSAGGFKLDMTGDHYQSNLCFRYHTHAQSAELDNRFFIACDSYSHLGGWLEGAFMSAINAVAGIVVAANGGRVATLNPQAQKLFTTLTPIT